VVRSLVLIDLYSALDSMLLKIMEESKLACAGDPPKSRWLRLQILWVQLRDRVSERQKIQEYRQELTDILDLFQVSII
jgi:hypothetical protein